MLAIDLSNNTRITVNLSLKDKALIIRQEATVAEPVSSRPPAEIHVPLGDVKKLVSSLKTLSAFLF